MNIQEFASLLFEIEVNAHIAHLQATGVGSYAKHGALDGLYKAMPELRDHFLEDAQGVVGIIKKYPPIKIYEEVDIISYLRTKSKAIAEYRLTLKEGFLQQDIDDILSEISSTLYKLVNLQ